MTTPMPVGIVVANDVAGEEPVIKIRWTHPERAAPGMVLYTAPVDEQPYVTALLECRAKFLYYQKCHEDKGGLEKAAINAGMVAMIDEVLAQVPKQ